VDSDSDDGIEQLEQFRLENIKDRPPIFDAEALHDAYEDVAWDTPKEWTQIQVPPSPSCVVSSVIQASLPQNMHGGQWHHQA
jgi:hypothetical protein